MEIDNETLQAIHDELSLFRFAEKSEPDMPVGHVKDCGCVGPLPECKCAKRERLVSEFINQFKRQVPTDAQIKQWYDEGKQQFKP